MNLIHATCEYRIAIPCMEPSRYVILMGCRGMHITERWICRTHWELWLKGETRKYCCEEPRLVVKYMTCLWGRWTELVTAEDINTA